MGTVCLLAWSAVLAISSLGSSGPVGQQSAMSDYCAKMIARTLVRLGESDVAKEFLAHHRAGRITFRGQEGSVIAETSGAGGSRSRMWLGYRSIHDLQRLLDRDPYGRNSPLVSAAVTVVHEMVHMNQTYPTESEQYELPAWKRADAAIAEWQARLSREWAEATRGGTASKLNLLEIQSLMKLVRQAAGELADGIRVKSLEGTLPSTGVSWRVGQTRGQADEALALMDRHLGGSSTVCWKLVRVESEPPVNKVGEGSLDSSYRSTSGPLSIELGWTKPRSKGHDVWNWTANWSAVPESFGKSDTIQIKVRIEVTADIGDVYSQGGSFSVYFDDADVPIGHVRSPVYPVTADGKVQRSFSLRHTGSGVKVHSMELVLDGRALPSAPIGRKVALVFDAYNGKSGRTRYIYELRNL